MIFERKTMKRIQNEDVKYEPTSGQNIIHTDIDCYSKAF